MLPGMLVMIVMPLLVTSMGVGSEARSVWMKGMGMLSALALPSAIAEFFFTCERVADHAPKSSVRMVQQLRACLSSRVWLRTVSLVLFLQLANSFSASSLLYYCNWVLGQSVQQGAGKQILLSALGQAPMGLGALALWPAVRKWGRRRTAAVGFAIAAAGSGMILLDSTNLLGVLAGLFIRSFGTLPTYLLGAFQASAMDDAERVSGFRADGFSASVMGNMQSLALGVSQSLITAGLALFGYITPKSVSEIIVQPLPLRTFLLFCFALLPAVFYALCAWTQRKPRT